MHMFRVFFVCFLLSLAIVASVSGRRSHSSHMRAITQASAKSQQQAMTQAQVMAMEDGWLQSFLSPFKPDLRVDGALDDHSFLEASVDLEHNLQARVQAEAMAALRIASVIDAIRQPIVVKTIVDAITLKDITGQDFMGDEHTMLTELSTEMQTATGLSAATTTRVVKGFWDNIKLVAKRARGAKTAKLADSFSKDETAQAVQSLNNGGLDQAVQQETQNVQDAVDQTGGNWSGDGSTDQSGNPRKCLVFAPTPGQQPQVPNWAVDQIQQAVNGQGGSGGSQQGWGGQQGGSGGSQQGWGGQQGSQDGSQQGWGGQQGGSQQGWGGQQGSQDGSQQGWGGQQGGSGGSQQGWGGQQGSQDGSQQGWGGQQGGSQQQWSQPQ